MRCISYFCGAMVLAVTHSATASELFSPPGDSGSEAGIYVSGGAAVKTFSAPSYHGSYSNVANGTGASDNAFAIDFDRRLVLSGAEGELGVVLPDDLLPSTFGRRVRLAVSARGLSGEADERGSAQFASSGNNSIDGANGSFNAALAVSHDTYVKVDQNETTYDVSAATDYQLSDSFSVSPSVRLMYGKTSADIHTRNFVSNRGDLVVQDFALKSRDLGGSLGLAGTYSVTPWLDLGIGGHMGIVRRISTLDASDCGEGGTATGVFDSCSGAAWTTSASDKHTKTAWLSGLIMAIRGHTDAWSAELSGSVDYESDVASYRTPTGTETAAASIVYDDRVSYGALFRVSYSFY